MKSNELLTLRELLRRTVKPPERLLVSEWAERHRVLPEGSTEPGPYRTARTPYMREPMDCLSESSPVTTVIISKAAQVGATEAANCFIGYVFNHNPGDTLVTMPNLEGARKMSRGRVAPMFDDMQLRGLDGGKPEKGSDSVLEKKFQGGTITLAGAKATTGLRHVAAQNLIMDEIDEYEDDVDGQGPAIDLAMARTTTYHSRKKILAISTPTIKGQSNIERMYEASDQRRYYVPCPECGHYQELKYGNLVFDSKAAFKDRLVTLRCEDCAASIEEGRKTEMLANGEWRPTAESSDPAVRGYHISSLYSPAGWLSWAAVVEEHLQATREAERGYMGKLKVWENTRMGKTWDSLTYQKVNPEKLMNRREDYNAAPEKVLCLTAGVDVQQDRLELEIVGWGAGEESWSLQYHTVPGDTRQAETWDSLQAILNAPIPNQAGGFDLAEIALIDSGYRIDEVEDFACRYEGACLVFPSKGLADYKAPVFTVAESKRTPGLQVFNLGTARIKDMVFENLEAETPGLGYCHFPRRKPYNEAWFKQLAFSEELKPATGRDWRAMRWKKTGRNEALDCRVYAFAGMKALLDTAAEVEQRRVNGPPSRFKSEADALHAALSRPAPAGTGWQYLNEGI